MSMEPLAPYPGFRDKVTLPTNPESTSPWSVFWKTLFPPDALFKKVPCHSRKGQGKGHFEEKERYVGRDWAAQEALKSDFHKIPIPGFIICKSQNYSGQHNFSWTKGKLKSITLRLALTNTKRACDTLKTCFLLCSRWPEARTLMGERGGQTCPEQ